MLAVRLFDIGLNSQMLLFMRYGALRSPNMFEEEMYEFGISRCVQIVA